MAVERIVSTATLAIQVQNGVDNKGNTKYRSLSFSNLRTNASDENIYTVAKAIAGILSSNIGNINIKESSQLIEN